MNYESLKYNDVTRGVTFSLNVLTGNVELVSEYVIPNEQVQSLKNEIVKYLDAYIAEDFKAGTALGTVYIDGDSELTI